MKEQSTICTKSCRNSPRNCKPYVFLTHFLYSCNKKREYHDIKKFVVVLSRRENFFFVEKLFQMMTDVTMLDQQSFEDTVKSTLLILEKLMETDYPYKTDIIDIAMRMVARMFSISRGDILLRALKVAASLLHGGN